MWNIIVRWLHWIGLLLVLLLKVVGNVLVVFLRRWHKICKILQPMGSKGRYFITHTNGIFLWKLWQNLKFWQFFTKNFIIAKILAKLWFIFAKSEAFEWSSPDLHENFAATEIFRRSQNYISFTLTKFRILAKIQKGISVSTLDSASSKQ